MNTLGRLAVVMLLALGFFQLCEYHVCGGYGIRASEWSRAGYAAITLLPPLGLHILHVLAGKPKRRLIMAAYVTMVGFIAYFLFKPAVFDGYACTGNYVIFQIGLTAARAYGVYYYGWLLTALALGFRWTAKSGTAALKRRRVIQALMVGYLVFLLPTAIANTVNPETRRGIPSIMCGFAVLFAAILAGYILPRAGLSRSVK